MLCEISGKGEWVHRPPTDHAKEVYRFASCDRYSFALGLPPDDVRSWAGLSCGQMDGLAELNDDGRTFDEIADVLESWIEKEKAGTV